MEIISTPEFWIALLSGGLAVKLVEFFSTRRERNQNHNVNVKEDLKGDIAWLREQVEDLRVEVEQLKRQINEKDKEISIWQKKYWEEKIRLDKIVLHVRHHGSDDLLGKVRGVIGEEESLDGN